jgi:hypothetical protein
MMFYDLQCVAWVDVNVFSKRVSSYGNSKYAVILEHFYKREIMTSVCVE